MKIRKVRELLASRLAMLVCLTPLAASAQIVTATVSPSTATADLNAATANLDNVSVLVIPKGRYTLTSTWNILEVGSGIPRGQANEQVLTHDVKIIGYGVELVTPNLPGTPATGTFPAITIQFANSPYQLTLEGFTIDHTNNDDAYAGIEVVQSAHVHLNDITVEANGTRTGYAAFLLRSATASGETGTFWTVIDHCSVGKRSSLLNQSISAGIKLQGGANATTIRNCSFRNVDYGVQIIAPPNGSYIANGVLIEGNWFEGFSEAIRVVSSPIGSTGTYNSASGLRVLNNRAETGVTFFRYGGPGANPAEPPILSYNYLSNVQYLIENDAAQKVVIFDAPTLPSTTSVHVNGR